MRTIRKCFTKYFTNTFYHSQNYGSFTVGKNFLLYCCSAKMLCYHIQKNLTKLSASFQEIISASVVILTKISSCLTWGNSYKVILTWRDVKIFFQDNDIFRFGINVESSRQGGFIMLRNSCIPNTYRCMLQNEKEKHYFSQGCNLYFWVIQKLR